MDTRQTSQATATACRPGSSWCWLAWLAGIRGTCVRPLRPETRRRPGSTQIPARSQENRIPTLSGQRGGSGAARTPCARACVSLGKPAAAAAPGWKRPARGGRPPHTPGTLLVPRGPVRPPLPATDASPAGGSGRTCPGGGASAGRSEPAAAPSKPSRRRLGGSEGRDFHLGCARPGSLRLRAPVSFPLGRLSTEKCSLEPRSRTRSPTLAEGSEVAPLAESASSGLDRGSRPRPENLSPCSVARGEENRQLSSLKRPVNSRLSFVFYSCL